MEQAAEPDFGYEQQLTQALTVHASYIGQLVAWDRAWHVHTVQAGRLGRATRLDIDGVLEDYQAHVARLPDIVEERLRLAQDYFAATFAQSPLDEQRWRSIRLHLGLQPLTAEIPMHIDMVQSQPARQALRTALDLDVWRRLRYDTEVYGQEDPRARLALTLASTASTAQLMAAAVDGSRQQRALGEIDQFRLRQFLAGEAYNGRSENAQSLIGFGIRYYVARQRSRLR